VGCQQDQHAAPAETGEVAAAMMAAVAGGCGGASARTGGVTAEVLAEVVVVNVMEVGTGVPTGCLAATQVRMIGRRQEPVSAAGVIWSCSHRCH